MKTFHCKKTFHPGLRFHTCLVDRYGVIQPLRNGLRREGGAVPGVTPIVLNNRLKVKKRYKGGREGQKMSENGVT